MATKCHTGGVELLLRIGINAVALWVTTALVPGIAISGPEGQAGILAQVVSLVIVGVIFGAVNAVVKPIVKFLSFPVVLLTLGLFTFVVNALMLQLTSWLTGFTPLSFTIGSFFWDAILGSIIVSIVSMVLNSVLVHDRD